MHELKKRHWQNLFLQMQNKQMRVKRIFEISELHVAHANIFCEKPIEINGSRSNLRVGSKDVCF